MQKVVGSSPIIRSLESSTFSSKNKSQVPWPSKWYQFVVGASSTINQSNYIAKSNYFVFNGAVSPAWNGTDVMIHYNTSNADQTVQLFARARSALTPLGGFGRESNPIYTSPNAYEDVGAEHECDTFNECDWGDYAAAVPEPRHARWIWGANQAVRTPDGVHQPWLTKIFAGRVSG